MLQHCHELVIISSELAEIASLVVKKFGDRLNRVAVLELDGEWVSYEIYPCLSFVLLQSRLK
jgi:hypothetical protein